MSTLFTPSAVEGRHPNGWPPSSPWPTKPWRRRLGAQPSRLLPAPRYLPPLSSIVCRLSSGPHKVPPSPASKQYPASAYAGPMLRGCCIIPSQGCVHRRTCHSELAPRCATRECGCAALPEARYPIAPQPRTPEAHKSPERRAPPHTGRSGDAVLCAASRARSAKRGISVSRRQLAVTQAHCATASFGPPADALWSMNSPGQP